MAILRQFVENAHLVCSFSIVTNVRKLQKSFKNKSVQYAMD